MPNTCAAQTASTREKKNAHCIFKTHYFFSTIIALLHNMAQQANTMQNVLA